MITELRRYRIKPGRMESWLAFFEEVVAESAVHGIRVEYAGVDPEDGTFVWLRSFDDETDRAGRKAAFYGSAWWHANEARAMSHVEAYQVTFLDAAWVREAGGPSRMQPSGWSGPMDETVDEPPSGWVRSTQVLVVPARPGRG